MSLSQKMLTMFTILTINTMQNKTTHKKLVILSTLIEDITNYIDRNEKLIKQSKNEIELTERLFFDHKLRNIFIELGYRHVEAHMGYGMAAEFLRDTTHEHDEEGAC